MPSSAVSNSPSGSRRHLLLQALRAEKQRRRSEATQRFSKWQADPIGFIEQELFGFVWSKQRDICQSVVDNRYTAVKACHGPGKTAIAARIGAWWLSVWPPGQAFLVTSAPTRDQVRALLWREINKVHRAGGLPGRTNQTEWFFDPNEIVGFGRAVRDTDPTAFQGIHARRVLVILDEACGIPRIIWEAAETLITNEDSRFLAIGNPDDPSSAFADACKPGSGYNVITISAFETPNLTGEEVPEWLRPLLVSEIWVEERRRKWGETSPLWTSKVRGEFPDLATDGLIPLGALHDATTRDLPAGEPNEFGVDVARFGDDKTTVYWRRGGVVRRVGELRKRDTMEVAGLVVRLENRLKPTAIKIDDTGLGGGVTDRLNELRFEGKIAAKVVPVIVGSRPTTDIDDEKYAKLRDQLNWTMRDRFIAGNIALLPPIDGLADDPEPLEGLEDLLAEAAAVKYRLTSAGQIAVEPKADMKKRMMGRSPDDWDGLVLAFASPDTGGELILPFQAAEVSADPIRIPGHWPQVAVIHIERRTFTALWAAWDRRNDTIYLTGEYVAPLGELAVHADAVRKRGAWVPILFSPMAAGRSKDEGLRIAHRLDDLRLPVFTVQADFEAGVTDTSARLATQRLKGFTGLQNWLGELQRFRRSEDGKFMSDAVPLMQATALLVRYGTEAGVTENRAASDEAGYDVGDRTRSAVTGY